MEGGRHSVNDVKLIRSLKRGQRGALDRAIACYSGYAAAVARSVLGNAATREDLEEIVSDVFVALWRTAERLDEDDLLTADEAQGPEAETLRREQAETLRRLLLEMAADDRAIFIRFYYYRQTVHEIASLMGMNESTVKARLARGRKKLRERLTKEVDGYADL